MAIFVILKVNGKMSAEKDQSSSLSFMSTFYSLISWTNSYLNITMGV